MILQKTKCSANEQPDSGGSANGLPKGIFTFLLQVRDWLKHQTTTKDTRKTRYDWMDKGSLWRVLLMYPHSECRHLQPTSSCQGMQNAAALHIKTPLQRHLTLPKQAQGGPIHAPTILGIATPSLIQLVALALAGSLKFPCFELLKTQAVGLLRLIHCVQFQNTILSGAT